MVAIVTHSSAGPPPVRWWLPLSSADAARRSRPVDRADLLLCQWHLSSSAVCRPSTISRRAWKLPTLLICDRALPGRSTKCISQKVNVWPKGPCCSASTRALFLSEVSRAQAQLNGTRTQLELAGSELARAEKLLPMQAVSVQEIDQLHAAQRNARHSPTWRPTKPP